MIGSWRRRKSRIDQEVLLHSDSSESYYATDMDLKVAVDMAATSIHRGDKV